MSSSAPCAKIAGRGDPEPTGKDVVRVFTADFVWKVFEKTGCVVAYLLYKELLLE